MVGSISAQLANAWSQDARYSDDNPRNLSKLADDIDRINTQHGYVKGVYDQRIYTGLKVANNISMASGVVGVARGFSYQLIKNNTINFLKGGKTFNQYKRAYWKNNPKPELEAIINPKTGQVWKQYAELHHKYIPQRSSLPNWLKNNRFNIKEMTSLGHAIVDPFRARFAPKWAKEMFNLFKKKRQLTKHDLEFLQKIVTALPKKYQYLQNQVTDEFMLGKKPNELGDRGDYCLTLNASLEQEFINKKLPQFFIIRGIEVWNKKQKNYESVELHIVQGIIFGYKLFSNPADLDLNNLSTKSVNEKHFNNEDINQVTSILGDLTQDEKTLIDIENSFKIEIPEGVFYTIKNLEDGNYLCINTSGEIYLLIHDPYVVKLIYKNISELIVKLNNNEFDISKYFSSD